MDLSISPAYVPNNARCSVLCVGGLLEAVKGISSGWHTMGSLRDLFCLIVMALGFFCGVRFWKAYYDDFWTVLRQWANREGYELVRSERRSTFRSPFGWSSS